MRPREWGLLVRAHRRRRRDAQQAPIVAAWWTENLRRRKRVPALQTLLTPPKARPLHGEELDARRAEFAEMSDLANRL